MTTPTGKVNFCCISHDTHVTDDEGEAYILDKQGFKEAWNASYMRNIRKRMLDSWTFEPSDPSTPIRNVMFKRDQRPHVFWLVYILIYIHISVDM